MCEKSGGILALIQKHISYFSKLVLFKQPSYSISSLLCSISFFHIVMGEVCQTQSYIVY